MAQTPTNALPVLSPAYPEIPPTFWEAHGAAILIGGSIFLALAAIVLGTIFRSRPQPVLPPELVARRALEKLQAQPETGSVLSAVSQILRRYVTAVFQLSAAELTTAEFCAALAQSQRINLELGEAISRFLRECDERKFSPPRRVEVQASACSENPSATSDTLKPELPPAAARALELLTLAEKETHQQDACAAKK